MKKLALALTLSLAALGAGRALAAADAIGASDRASLQAAMYQHIDRQLVAGSFLHLDTRDGRLEKLTPTKAHPMILRMGEHFVLCSDFRAPDGKMVNIDFYLARAGAGFKVFHTEIDNRPALEKLMAQGKITSAD